jgi:response regulator of citrate/malate metabolism
MNIQQLEDASPSHRVRAVLTALADNEITKILDSTMNHPKSVNEISKETNVSHTTAFRKKWYNEY